MPANTRPHISVCVCTYRRNRLLAGLLGELQRQETGGLFDYSIVVADNDSSQSAQQVVHNFKAAGGDIAYCVEPMQNIALARNRAVESARGEYIAFIDDDEIPARNWLLRLFQTCETYNADGVLGPVKPSFAVTPPKWTIKAGIFDRPNSQDYASGSVLHWNQTGTGNTLIQHRVFDELDGPFNRELGSGGEDLDFFRRAIAQGNVFVWCAEAVAHEIIPAERTHLSFQLRRALLRGKASLASPSGYLSGIVKSICAFVFYTILLPIYLMMGWHVFLKHLIKICDHLGKILGLCGIDLVKEKYVGTDSDNVVSAGGLHGDAAHLSREQSLKVT
jgi:succinoglycan biosynthesis protein ExoM